MSILIIFLIITLSLGSCESPAQEIKVSTNTVEYKIYGEPGPWIKHDNKYYLYFKTDNSHISSLPTNHFYILDANGRIEKKVAVPHELQTTYYDLFVKNDSIFTTEYWNQNTFYLDRKTNEWVKAKKADDLIYEDENYYVTSMDFGEWGGKTWFKNKLTKVQYELAATTPVINRLNDKYFVTTRRAVYRIDDPKNLIRSKNPYIYKKMVGQKGHFADESNSLHGAKVIFEDTISWWASKFSIATSFVLGEKLYHLYKDSISAKIGFIEDNKINPVYTLKSGIIPFKWHYDYRSRIQKNGHQTVQFKTEDKSVNGIIEFQNDGINITFLKNIHED